MPTYNLLKYSNDFPNSGSFWEYHKDDPRDIITDSDSFKFKARIKGATSATGNTNDTEISVPLKCLSNFWRNFEVPLINCEMNLILSLSVNC